MHAYFTGSIVGKKRYAGHYLTIIRELEKRSITVQSAHIMNTSEEHIRFETKRERLEFHKRLDRWIMQADFMVAETSFPSISVGYEISLALHRGKSVLVLYTEGDPPSLLADHTNEKIVCEKYTTDTLPHIIDDFLAYADGSSDTRFTFYITPAIASHLETIAKKQKLPKSVYLRRLIERDMP